MNTCPLCLRSWEITPYSDCLVPTCGCFGNDPWSGEAPCEPCGLSHAMSCPKMPNRKVTT